VRARAAAANAGAATAARQQRVREPQGRAEKSTPAPPEGRARRRRGLRTSWSLRPRAGRRPAGGRVRQTPTDWAATTATFVEQRGLRTGSRQPAMEMDGFSPVLFRFFLLHRSKRRPGFLVKKQFLSFSFSFFINSFDTSANY